jgi:hypothetical protein
MFLLAFWLVFLLILCQDRGISLFLSHSDSLRPRLPRFRETPPASRARHAYPAPRKKKTRAAGADAIFFTLERAEIRVDREKVEPTMKERRIPEAWHLGNGFN